MGGGRRSALFHQAEAFAFGVETLPTPLTLLGGALIVARSESTPDCPRLREITPDCPRRLEIRDLPSSGALIIAGSGLIVAEEQSPPEMSRD